MQSFLVTSAPALGARDRQGPTIMTLDQQPNGSPFATGRVVVQTGLGGALPPGPVRDNVIMRTSTDVVWDGTGTGTGLESRACQTSDPSGQRTAR
jgi:hypothetical protein